MMLIQNLQTMIERYKYYPFNKSSKLESLIIPDSFITSVHISVKLSELTLFVISLSDEYVPEFVYPKLGLRFKETVPGSSLCMIEGAIHSLASPEQAASQFLNPSLEHAAVCFSNRR